MPLLGRDPLLFVDTVRRAGRGGSDRDGSARPPCFTWNHHRRSSESPHGGFGPGAGRHL